jgi:hypothetical protein
MCKNLTVLAKKINCCINLNWSQDPPFGKFEEENPREVFLSIKGLRLKTATEPLRFLKTIRGILF